MRAAPTTLRHSQAPSPPQLSLPTSGLSSTERVEGALALPSLCGHPLPWRQEGWVQTPSRLRRGA